MKLPTRLLPWAEARQRHRLSDAHVQMARELGLNPKKLGKIDNHDQERWKAPLPQFIERIYLKHFGRARPEEVLSLEEIARREARKKAARRERKQARLGGSPDSEPGVIVPGAKPPHEEPPF
jgi:hypothetical protein